MVNVLYELYGGKQPKEMQHGQVCVLIRSF